MFTNPAEELSPIARCLQIAAARGRARRLARERAETLVVPSDDENKSGDAADAIANQNSDGNENGGYRGE